MKKTYWIIGFIALILIFGGLKKEAGLDDVSTTMYGYLTNCAPEGTVIGDGQCNYRDPGISGTIYTHGLSYRRVHGSGQNIITYKVRYDTLQNNMYGFTYDVDYICGSGPTFYKLTTQGYPNMQIACTDESCSGTQIPNQGTLSIDRAEAIRDSGITAPDQDVYIHIGCINPGYWTDCGGECHGTYPAYIKDSIKFNLAQLYECTNDGDCSGGAVCQIESGQIAGFCTQPCVDSIWTPDPSTVCVGDSFTQISNCGNERAQVGTMQPDCSCEVNTCVGQTCVNNCGTTCAGVKQGDCSAASAVCIGETIDDGCGGTCQGTKVCVTIFEQLVSIITQWRNREVTITRADLSAAIMAWVNE